MFQLINVISQSAIGAVALMVLEFSSIAAIALLAFRGWDKYQEGQHIRGPLRMDIIENHRKEALRNN